MKINLNKNLVGNLTRSANKIGFQLKKKSPEILVLLSVGGMITTTITACKATTKLSSIIENAKTDIEQIKDASSHPEKYENSYSEEDEKKDLAIIYAQTGVKIAKIYFPSIILGTLSITGILTSHKIMKQRNVALAAAYATIDKGYKSYRNRVAERFGEEVEKEIRYNIKAKEVEKTIVNDKGKEKVVKETLKVGDIEYSEYARFFDELSSYWEKDSEYNLLFLTQIQRTANEKLQRCGCLFLNEVYDMLDIPRSKAGQIVGWVYDENNADNDNYIDFGIYELNRPNRANREFVNGYEPSILLDFNVDGDVWSLM